MSVQILSILWVQRLFCLLYSSILQEQPFQCFLVLKKPLLVQFCFVTWVLLKGFVPFLQFFHNISNFILKVFLCLFLSGTWESGSDKVNTEIQGLSSTDWYFQRLSKPWFFLKIQGLWRTFNVCATPVLSVFLIFVLRHLVTAHTHNTKKLPIIQII